MRKHSRHALAWLCILAGGRAPLGAHDGPPFPIVTDRQVGSYRIAVWTDPDATDDGSAGGQFWIMLDTSGSSSGEIPSETRVEVSVRPAGAAGAWQAAPAAPLRDDVSRQFAALVMDHEGRFDVRVNVTGPLGEATVSAWVDATYDLRPPPVMLVIYAIPFVVLGVFWVKLLVRRRRSGVAPGLHPPAAAAPRGTRTREGARTPRPERG